MVLGKRLGGLGIDKGVWNQVISATLPPSGIHKRQFSDRVVDLLKNHEQSALLLLHVFLMHPK